MSSHALSTQHAMPATQRREYTLRLIGGLLGLLVLLGLVAGLWRMVTGLGAALRSPTRSRGAFGSGSTSA